MLKDQPILPCNWIAHNCKDSSMFNKTLRPNLHQCMAAYIWQNIIPPDVRNERLCGLLEDGSLATVDEIIDEYRDQIPDDIKFVLVRLQPVWESEKQL